MIHVTWDGFVDYSTVVRELSKLHYHKGTPPPFREQKFEFEFLSACEGMLYPYHENQNYTKLYSPWENKIPTAYDPKYTIFLFRKNSKFLFLITLFLQFSTDEK